MLRCITVAANYRMAAALRDMGYDYQHTVCEVCSNLPTKGTNDDHLCAVSSDWIRKQRRFEQDKPRTLAGASSARLFLIVVCLVYDRCDAIGRWACGRSGARADSRRGT